MDSFLINCITKEKFQLRFFGGLINNVCIKLRFECHASSNLERMDRVGQRVKQA